MQRSFEHTHVIMMDIRIYILLSFSLLCCEALKNDSWSCDNEIHSLWGQRSFYSQSEEDFVPIEEIELGLLKQSIRREEPVSAWVKIWLDFVIKDLVELEPKENGYLNVATPTLDLSNLKLNKRNEIGIVFFLFLIAELIKNFF